LGDGKEDINDKYGRKSSDISILHDVYTRRPGKRSPTIT